MLELTPKFQALLAQIWISCLLMKNNKPWITKTKQVLDANYDPERNKLENLCCNEPPPEDDKVVVNNLPTKTRLDAIQVSKCKHQQNAIYQTANSFLDLKMTVSAEISIIVQKQPIRQLFHQKSH